MLENPAKNSVNQLLKDLHYNWILDWRCIENVSSTNHIMDKALPIDPEF